MCRPDPSKASPHRRHEEVPQKLRVFFRLGRLRFGFHGMVASTALVVTSLALLSLAINTPKTSNNAITNSLLYLSVIFNSCTALQAQLLLDQVPLQTEILPGIAPHREAFKRTMSMMHYCNLRILACLFQPNNYIIKAMYILFLAFFIFNRFLPRGHFDNGNTWIFVVPMCIGTLVDLLQYTCFGDTILTIHHYLIVQISALVIAFLFTLAFRGYVSVLQIYVVSATVVASLLGGGLCMIVSSIL